MRVTADGVATVLHLIGYPTAVVVIARWVPVVRERRTRWFAIHQAGTAAIVAGWAIRGNVPAAAFNGAWFLVAAAWYAAGGRR